MSYREEEELWGNWTVRARCAGKDGKCSSSAMVSVPDLQAARTLLKISGWRKVGAEYYCAGCAPFAAAKKQQTKRPARRQGSMGKWWEVLDVPRTASRHEIKIAYRNLARTAHPDHGGSKERMQQINIARDKALREVA